MVEVCSGGPLFFSEMGERVTLGILACSLVRGEVKCLEAGLSRVLETGD